MRLVLKWMLDNYSEVSIHASVKDATVVKGPYRGVCCFNPRIRKGCDFEAILTDGPGLCFNPRIRKGCDPTITTKTLTRRSFNPRIRKGCDGLAKIAFDKLLMFQSTHP